MSKETLNRAELEEQPCGGVRSVEEIQARMSELEKKIQEHDVWIHRGYSTRPEPTAFRKQKTYRAKLNELRWVLGIEDSASDNGY